MRPILLALVLTGSMAQVSAPSALLEARRAYNEGRFDDAIALAEQARAVTETADSAGVVLARARLERFRTSAAPDDLAQARLALYAVNAGRLDAETHVEYLIGLGECLYLNDPPEYGAAAEFFEVALVRASLAAPAQRDVVFDWWAGALDRLVEFGPSEDRQQVYDRMLRGAERHRELDDGPGVVWYWLAKAARGLGDIERAWGAAVAGWVRAATLGEPGDQLRRDLDQLVVQVILPERAARFAPSDPPSALPRLQAQWDAIKARWGGGRP